MRDPRDRYTKTLIIRTKIKWYLLGLKPRPSVSIHLSVVLAYLNTLKSAGSALGGS
jgi:hypothetical protein